MGLLRSYRLHPIVGTICLAFVVLAVLFSWGELVDYGATPRIKNLNAKLQTQLRQAGVPATKVICGHDLPEVRGDIDNCDYYLPDDPRTYGIAIITTDDSGGFAIYQGR